MDQIRKAMEESEKLRLTLPRLREDKTKPGLIKYNKTLLEVTDRQHNMYARLMLMDDPMSRETAAEMQKVAEDYMGKDTNVSMDSFFKQMKREITFQLNLLTCSKYDRPEDEG